MPPRRKFLVPEQNPSYFRGTVEELLLPPMPIDVKVVLIASPGLFQELHEADPEFSQLFKVQARFEPTLPLTEAMLTYPAFLAGLTRDRGLPHVTADRDDRAPLLRRPPRREPSQSHGAGSGRIADEVTTEAGYRAMQRGQQVIDGAEVIVALAAARRRGGHFRDQVHELLSEGIIRIDVTGEKVGQVNAISVVSDGPQTFGRPCRVTAVVYAGVEGPINIAREVEMSGPLHSKGVPHSHRLPRRPFRAVSIRSSSEPPSSSSKPTKRIDGDSASSSELYALLSALSGFPLRQELAVTGSVDQQGSVQPVGGINEKVEAFFDVCVAKGLTGKAGCHHPEDEPRRPHAPHRRGPSDRRRPFPRT